jgi:hypothetical protein
VVRIGPTAKRLQIIAQGFYEAELGLDKFGFIEALGYNV